MERGLSRDLMNNFLFDLCKMNKKSEGGLSGVPVSNFLIEFRKTQQQTWRKADPGLSGIVFINPFTF